MFGELCGVDPAPVLELPRPYSGAVPDRAVSCTCGCWALNLTQLHKTRRHPSLGFFQQCRGFIPFCGQKLTTSFLKTKVKVWTVLCLNGKHHTWVTPVRFKICAEERPVPNISLFCSSTYCNWFFCLFTQDIVINWCQISIVICRVIL